MPSNDLKRAVLDLLRGYLMTVWLFLSFQHPGFAKDRWRGIQPSQIILALGFLLGVAAHWWLVDFPNAIDTEERVVPLLRMIVMVANLPLFGGAALALAFMAFSTGLNGLTIFMALLAPGVSTELKWAGTFAEMAFIVYYGFVVRTVSPAWKG